MDNFEVKSIRKGDVLEGKVVEVRSDGFLVDIGYKVEGLIPSNEANGELRQDDVVKAEVLKVYEDDDKPVLLSKKRADKKRALEEIERAYKDGSTIMVKGVKSVKGGMLVDLLGVEGFVPYSHLEVDGKKPRMSELLGKEFGVKVKEFGNRGRKLVMSRKMALEEEIQQARERFFSSIEEGAIIEGKVSGITDFGVFVDLGALEGLIHISEASWRKDPDLNKLFKKGQTVKAKVIKLDPAEGKVRLSVKQLVPNPWESIEERFKVGDIVEGEVTKITGFGAFVAVDENIEGLIHIKDISWERVNDVHEVLKEGEMVKVKILDINPKEKRLYLGRKQVEDPWNDVEKEFKKGDIVEGRVSRIESFGAFVELKKGVEGLVHISNISREHIQTPGEKVKEGDVVKVKILDIDTNNRRIRLSIKDAEERSGGTATSESAKVRMGDEEPSFTLGDLYKGFFADRR